VAHGRKQETNNFRKLFGLEKNHGYKPKPKTITKRITF
jgi:hypothetical protein